MELIPYNPQKMPAQEVNFFNWPNMAIMVVYFGAMLLVGCHFARKNKSTESYFLAGKSVPSWAIGLSMLSASMSSITFLAMPAAAFAVDWRQIVPNLSLPIVAVIAMIWFIPFFRRNAQVSAFEYLHKRYGTGVRLYSSIVFLLIQVARLGAILYLLVIPTQLITGMDPMWTIILVGGISASYTLMGGMASAIWNEVVQSLVLLFGGIAAVLVIIYNTPGGFGALIDVANAHDKFSLGPMSWDPSERTFWTMLTTGIVMWTSGYATDQNMVQRYLSARSTREARQATFICAALSLPTWSLFFLIGTCLFAFYKIVPDATVAGLANDAVFPHFILTKLPAGISGLVIAGVFSAAMGTISSGLTAFSTVMTTDIFRPYLIKGRADAFYAKLARLIMVVTMLVIFAIAFALLHWKGEGIMDYNYKINGLLSGVVVCFYLLGFFAPRVNRRVVWAGFSVAFSLNAYLLLVQSGMSDFLHLNISPYWVSTFVVSVMIVLCLAIAYIGRTTPDASLDSESLRQKK